MRKLSPFEYALLLKVEAETLDYVNEVMEQHGLAIVLSGIDPRYDAVLTALARIGVEDAFGDGPFYKTLIDEANDHKHDMDVLRLASRPEELDGYGGNGDGGFPF